MVWLLATGLCTVNVVRNILQQFYPSDKETLVTGQDFSSATWYADNSTPSLRDRRPGWVTQIMEKKWSQSLANFLSVCVMGRRGKSACLMSQWRVGSSRNDVKMHVKKWGDTLSWAADGDGSELQRNTFSLYDLWQGDSSMWDVGVLSYISQNPSLWSHRPTTYLTPGGRALHKEKGFPLKNFLIRLKGNLTCLCHSTTWRWAVRSAVRARWGSELVVRLGRRGEK